ncbi:MAG TPA: hypothetical protein VIL36_21270 [Acidimicrobiales bacterium]
MDPTDLAAALEDLAGLLDEQHDQREVIIGDAVAGATGRWARLLADRYAAGADEADQLASSLRDAAAALRRSAATATEAPAVPAPPTPPGPPT